LVDLNTLPHCLDGEALTVRAIVETPPGRRIKFDYDAESGLFALHDVLPAGMAFPMAFGFVPDTLGEDGDPLDALRPPGGASRCRRAAAPPAPARAVRRASPA